MMLSETHTIQIHLDRLFYQLLRFKIIIVRVFAVAVEINSHEMD